MLARQRSLDEEVMHDPYAYGPYEGRVELLVPIKYVVRRLP
jgi:hypothetical protein